jgi:hypothetical protein
LERRTGRGTGRDNIDHPPGGHDDVCNAAAGAATMTGSRYRYPSGGDMSWVSDDSPEAADAAEKQWQEQRFNQHVLYHGGYYNQLPVNRWR